MKDHRNPVVPSLLIALVLLTPLALAWSPLGPPGGGVEQVAFGGNGNRIYGIVSGRLWVSTDGGVTYHEPSVAARSIPITTLAVDPADPLHLWSRGRDHTVIESTDGGSSWRVLATLPGAPSLTHFTPDPWITGALDIAVNTGSNGPLNGVVRIRADGSWRLLLPAPAVPIEAMASGPGALYVATGNGFQRARWGGTAWEEVTDPAPGFTRMRALAVDPGDGRHLLAGTDSGLLSSRNGGVTWSRIPLPAGRVDRVSFGAGVAWCVTGNRLWLGRDGGSRWEPAGLEDALITALAPDPADPATVHVGVSGPAPGLDRSGLLRSTDSGRTFVPADDGIVATPIDALSAGTGEGAPRLLALSGDRPQAWDGASWRSLGVGPHHEATAIARDPHDPARLWATSFVESGDTYGDALFVSDDGGRTFHRRSEPVPHFWFTELAVDPADPDRVFGAGDLGLVLFHADTGGDEPALVWAEAFDSIVALEDPPGVVLAAGVPGLWRSVDDGTSWTKILDGSVDEPAHLAVAPEGQVYVLGEVGTLLGSSDGGLTWHPLTPPGQVCRDLAVSPWNTKRLAAVCREPMGRPAGSSWGVVWSADGGRRWRPVPGPPGLTATAVAFDPVNRGRLYVGTEAHGVWEGRPGGAVRRVGRRPVPIEAAKGARAYGPS